jgi:hypothetical protein
VTAMSQLGPNSEVEASTCEVCFYPANGHGQAGPACPVGAKSGSGPSKHPTKSRPKAALQFNLMLADQAAINAGFDFRRYAMKPTPANPISSIAHVEGSGTGAAKAIYWNGVVQASCNSLSATKVNSKETVTGSGTLGVQPGLTKGEQNEKRDGQGKVLLVIGIGPNEIL